MTKLAVKRHKPAGNAARDCPGREFPEMDQPNPYCPVGSIGQIIVFWSILHWDVQMIKCSFDINSQCTGREGDDPSKYLAEGARCFPATSKTCAGSLIRRSVHGQTETLSMVDMF